MPSSRSLSDLVRRRVEKGERPDRAVAAVIEAAGDGKIIATGRPSVIINLRFGTHLGDRVPVPAAAWRRGPVECLENRVGRYEQVRIEDAVEEEAPTIASSDLRERATCAAVETVDTKQSDPIPATVRPNETGGPADRGTVSLAELKRVIKEHGDASEAKLFE